MENEIEVRDKDERRLKKVKIGLMRSELFVHMSGIMMMGKTRIDDDLPTACTNGRDETYGRGFIRELRDDKQLAFVVIHEGYHKAYQHLSTWRKLFDKNPRLTNQACDYHINLKISDLDPDETVVAFPMKDGKKWGLIDERFRGLNSKQIFDILEQEEKDNPDEPTEGGEGFDEHDWEGAKNLSKEDKETLAREVDQAIRQGMMAQKKCGVGAGGIDRELEELTQPKVNWRDELREFVNSICCAKDQSSWRRVNRRFVSDGIYMPTLVGEKIGWVVVGQDTSGSMVEEIKLGVSEMQAILNEVHPERTDILYWDTAVAGHETYENVDVPDLRAVTKPKGGGGTDPTCMVPYMKDKSLKPDCIIIFTDGCINNWGTDWPAPVLWVVCGAYGKNIMAPVGKTIHIVEA